MERDDVPWMHEVYMRIAAGDSIIDIIRVSGTIVLYAIEEERLVVTAMGDEIGFAERKVHYACEKLYTKGLVWREGGCEATNANK